MRPTGYVDRSLAGRVRQVRLHVERKEAERKAAAARMLEDLRYEQKELRFEIKQVSPRRLDGYGSVFGEVDSHADIILPGAYTKTLAWWKEQGEWPPLLDHHDAQRSTAVIGKGLKMKEDHHGLLCSFELVAGEEGEKIAARIKQGLVTGLSIGYAVMRKRGPTAVERARGAERILEEVWLREISLVQSPSNRLARVTAVKIRNDMEIKDLYVDEMIEMIAAEGWEAVSAGLNAHEESEVIELLERRIQERRLAA